MTAPPTTRPDPDPAGGTTHRHTATPAQLSWLEAQLAQWRAEGVLDEATAETIRGRYVAHRRVTLSRIVLTLGSAFVGIGLIWFVAANLDELSPLTRFLLVTVLWLGFVAAAEALQRRRERAGDVASPVVGAVRMLAVVTFGAVVFQAAQSLQVPAFEPVLVGLWALGVLCYGYAVGALGPVVLGVGLGAYWFVWQSVASSQEFLAILLAVAAAALAAVAVGVLHSPARHPDLLVLGVPWREIGALLALGTLFVAALPYGDVDPPRGTGVWVAVGVAVLLAGTALVLGRGLDRLETTLAVAALGVTTLLALWRYEEGATSVDELSGGELARAVVAVLVYLAVASGYAVLGGMRDSGRLTWVATAALVVFVTTQAFAVFAPILSGAALFLSVGVVLLGTGFLADRGRRRLVTEVKEVRP